MLTLLIALGATGLGLVPVLGIGLLLLVAFVYALFATAWVEQARVEGLYGFGLAALPPRRSARPGFAGFLRTLWQQATDAGMWRGIANATISMILGLVVLTLVSGVFSGIVLVLAPVFASSGQVPLLGTWIRVPIAAAVTLGVVQVLVGIGGSIGLETGRAHV